MRKVVIRLMSSVVVGLILILLPGSISAKHQIENFSTLDPVKSTLSQPDEIGLSEPQLGPPVVPPQQQGPNNSVGNAGWPQIQPRGIYPIGFLRGPAAGDPLDVALDYIRQNQRRLGLTDDDLADIIVRDRYTTQHNQVTHIYLRQQLAGIEVFNGDIGINIDREGRVINLNNGFVSNLKDAVNSQAASLSAIEAVERAAQHLGLTITAPLTPRRTIGGPAQEVVLSDGGISLDDIPVKLMYQPHHAEARLVWQMLLRLTDGLHWWNLRVDAVTGQILSQNDWIVNDTYQVFALPVINPDDGTRTIQTNPADPTASPFGWHDTNGLAGAEFTDTRGNNVFAQEDSDANDSGGVRPDGGAGLNFAFPLDLGQEPNTYPEAAITNLFYWNNILHDVHYQYGFDEAGGNFQVNNYGRAGFAGDPVQADAQDGSGTDNANFGTPPDGFDPRMQMFVWTFTTPNRDSDLDNGVIIHEYGHGVSNRLTGGPSNSSCLFNFEQMGEGWSDWWTLALTAKAGDTGPDARGVGTYLLGQPPDGSGIRLFPYSTDLGVNPQTYDDIKSVPVPHGVGAVWTAILWEVYWNLVDQHGFDPDFYHGTGGNNLAMQLVMDGLKLQSCSPSFIDGRDAILQADLVNNGGANQCLIWDGFAKRGLGVSAQAGNSNSVTDGSQAFDVPTECSNELTLTKRASPAIAQAGQTLSYTLVAGNFTATSLTGVILTDTVPLSTTYVPGSASDGGSESGGVVQWAIGALAPKAVVTRTFQVTVDPNFDNTPVSIFFDDMESGGGNWTATGLWHLEADSDPCGNSFSPTSSWYYGQSPGCTYDTGGSSNSGQLTTAAPIALPASLGQVTLTFQSWESTENLSGFDNRRVFISTDGSTFSPIFDSVNNAADWYEVQIDLSSYAGQNIWLRFEFDTVDFIANFFPGWYVDDVHVTGQLTVDNTASVTANEGNSDATTIRTPVIKTALLNYNPAQIEETMLLNQVVSNTLTLSNFGTLPLTFSLTDRNVPAACNLLNNLNNDFEAGDFTNWTVVDSVNANWFTNDGTYPRIIDGATTPPLAGNFSALADELGPSLNILYQDIALPTDLSGAILLSWLDQWENHAGQFTNDQEFRVGLYGPGGTPFIGELFSTKPGDPAASGSTSRTVDVASLIAPYAGQSVRLQVEVEASLFFFNVQVDEFQLCQDYVSWVTLSSTGGTIPPFSDTTVEVIFNSNAVTQPGDYQAELLFSGNMANSVTPQSLIMHIPGSIDLSGNIYLPFIRKN